MTIEEIIRCIDLTSLEATDTDRKITEMTEKINLLSSVHGLAPAAICVFPLLVKSVKNTLSIKNVRIASVCGAFPSGQTSIRIKCAEAEYALSEGAEEIDMVICRGKLLAGDEAYIRKEIEALRSVCGKQALKVILETGELDRERIIVASRIAIDAGADYIKTSTGKSAVGATMEAVSAICDAVAGKPGQTGIKISGGIVKKEDAEAFYSLILSKTGFPPHPGRFRIGASRLMNTLLEEKGIEGIRF